MTPTSQQHRFAMPWQVGFLAQKVMTISSQPGEVNSGKNSGRILFTMKQRNFIRLQVGKRRNELDWTQDYLADRLQDAGWQNATRSTVSKIEDGSLRIDLTQLYYLAVALRVHPVHFLPKIDWSKPVKAQINFP
jgi:hypothetical protein